MGRSSGSVDQQSTCSRVLPIIDEEEPEPESLEPAPESTKEGRKQAVVARMKELLKRAAAEQSAQSSRLRSSTLAAAKKWKRAVSLRINSSTDGGARKLERRLQLVHDDRRMSSSSSSVSSKSSFSSWAYAVAADDTLSSPASASAPSRTMAAHQWITTDSNCKLRQFTTDGLSSPASASAPSRTMAAHQWITTDSNFVVLEL